MSKELRSPALESGWTELAAGRWSAALACFEAAVAAGEGPEAFEGLSWAAWWHDDAALVFDARRRGYGLYKKRGDAAGAARMATWLGCDQLDFRGATAVASGWFARAHRLIDALEPGPEHAWLSFFEGYLASAAGDTRHALELATQASTLGRRLDAPDVEMLGLALEGATLVACARVPAGMSRLDEATAIALESEAAVPISGAWTCCFLVTACAAVRDYERAYEWCDRIAEFAERYGSRYMLAFCRAEYGTVDLWRGRWTEAERLLEASVEDFAQSRPAMVGGPLVTLAELRRRQGRTQEATLLLDEAGPVSTAQLCRARLALDRGDATRAAELAERVLRQLPAQGKLGRVPALELLIRARIARGGLDEARSALEALRGIALLGTTSALRGAVDMAEGLLAAAGGEHERARASLEDAVDRFERSGGRFESAQARIELATSLIALGRTDAAEREAGAALEQLLELGAVAEAQRARRIVESATMPGAPSLRGLTPREREVLCLLAEGLTNRQIAARLVVSEHTVHRHVSSILGKLELPSRTAAAAHAVRCGVLE